MIGDADKERIRLVELDQAQTADFVKSVVGSGATMRGAALTIWLALLGFAFQQELAILAFLAALIAVAFGIVDAYHGWLYAEAAKHARAAEKVTSSYYAALSRGDDDEDAILDFEADLRAHRFGLFTTFPEFDLARLRDARPRLIYQGLYPLLVAIAIAGGIAVATDVIGSDDPEPTRVIIEERK